MFQPLARSPSRFCHIHVCQSWTRHTYINVNPTQLSDQMPHSVSDILSVPLSTKTVKPLSVSRFATSMYVSTSSRGRYPYCLERGIVHIPYYVMLDRRFVATLTPCILLHAISLIIIFCLVSSRAGSNPTIKNRASILFSKFQAKESILCHKSILFIIEESLIFKRIVTHDSPFSRIDPALLSFLLLEIAPKSI